jgi:ATP-dependent exoDNAse (exonuclease V) alpha subunit
VCDLETSRIGAPYIYNVRLLRVNKPLVFERKILRKIFGPNNENGICRIKTNQELDEIIKRKNIINIIRAQTLSWLGHIERMQGTRMVKAIYS